MVLSSPLHARSGYFSVIRDRGKRQQCRQKIDALVRVLGSVRPLDVSVSENEARPLDVWCCLLCVTVWLSFS